MGTGFLTPLLQSLWCSALQPACQAFLAALRPAVARPHTTAPLEQLCGLPVMMVWRPLPVVGKLDHTMPRGPTCRVPSCAGLPDVQACYLEPVQGSPFHSWTRSCARVAGGPVHVWACPLILDGGPVRPSVLLWKPVTASAGCWLVPSWHPGQVPSVHSTDSTDCPALITLAWWLATATSSRCSSCCSPGW